MDELKTKDISKNDLLLGTVNNCFTIPMYLKTFYVSEIFF